MLTDHGPDPHPPGSGETSPCCASCLGPTTDAPSALPAKTWRSQTSVKQNPRLYPSLHQRPRGGARPRTPIRGSNHTLEDRRVAIRHRLRLRNRSIATPSPTRALRERSLWSFTISHGKPKPLFKDFGPQVKLFPKL
jgi:hypothetical protein